MSETIQPISNDDLRRAIACMHAGQNGEQEQMATLELLLKANLLSPVEVLPGEETQIRFCLLTTQDDRAFLPGFTDLEQMHMGFDNPQQKTVVLTFADYARMILKDGAAEGLVVNAFGESLTLERPLMEYLEKVRTERESAQ